MNKIEELINQLCPEGVEHRKLKKIANSITTGKLNANAQIENGIYPFFTCDSIPFRINTFAFDTEAIIVSGNGSQVGHVNYYKGKFNAYQRTYVISDFIDVNVQYILHYLKAYLREYIFINSKRGSVPYITMPIIENFKIPIPPLPIQEEIVAILDKFTQLEAELEAELEARKTQYEYYREKLLTFPELRMENGERRIEWKTLGELFDFKNGINKGKEHFGTGNSIINYTDVFNNRKIFTVKGRVETTPSDIKRYNCEIGDVFFTRTSETKEEIGYTSVLLSNIPDCVFSGFILRARPITSLLLPEYCAYCFSSHKVRKDIIRYSNMTTRVTTTGKNLSKIKIPIPPLAEQKRIVTILDKFDALVNDISVGLPAEIEARRKQYEYFREKLLTFPELRSEK